MKEPYIAPSIEMVAFNRNERIAASACSFSFTIVYYPGTGGGIGCKCGTCGTCKGGGGGNTSL
jgi:hypothetical protein